MDNKQYDIEERYQEAKELYQNAKTSDEMKKAAQLFEELGDYLASEGYAKQCKESAEKLEKSERAAEHNYEDRAKAYEEYLEKYPILKQIDELSAARERLMNANKAHKTGKVIKITFAVVLGLLTFFIGSFYYMGGSKYPNKGAFEALINSMYEAGVSVIILVSLLFLILLVLAITGIMAFKKRKAAAKQLKAINQTFEEIKKISPFEG